MYCQFSADTITILFVKVCFYRNCTFPCQSLLLSTISLVSECCYSKLYIATSEGNRVKHLAIVTVNTNNL